MNDLFHAPGFLGTHANFAADATLIVMLFTATLFSVGFYLARKEHFNTINGYRPSVPWSISLWCCGWWCYPIVISFSRIKGDHGRASSILWPLCMPSQGLAPQISAYFWYCVATSWCLNFSDSVITNPSCALLIRFTWLPRSWGLQFTWFGSCSQSLLQLMDRIAIIYWS